MARIDVPIEDTEIFDDDSGELREGVRATCPRCGHETESFGTGDASRRRCLVLLREECPMGDRNWYEEAG